MGRFIWMSEPQENMNFGIVSAVILVLYPNMDDVLTKEQIEKHKTNSQALPKFDYMRSKDIHPEQFGKLDRQARRSITPAGFAAGFYQANKPKGGTNSSQ